MSELQHLNGRSAITDLHKPSLKPTATALHMDQINLIEKLYAADAVLHECLISRKAGVVVAAAESGILYADYSNRGDWDCLEKASRVSITHRNPLW